MELPLLITPGDPRGVGPEVAVKALHQLGVSAILVGDEGAILAEAHRVGLACERLEALVPCRGVGLLVPPDGALPVEVAALEIAVMACLQGRAAGLVTGPIHKMRLARRGFGHPGHTGFLGALCGVRDPVMAFVAPRFRVALVTVHEPLAAVPGMIETARVARVIRLAHASLRDDLGIAEPRLVVAGLNPHAGEEGLLGDEEDRAIAPACEACRREGIDARGPLPAETAARLVQEGCADLLVAMYHDQGLIPLKLLDFGRAVNWTLGLPILRTSVDHGTADDIAGRDMADPGSMMAAITLAREILERRAASGRAGAPIYMA